VPPNAETQPPFDHRDRCSFRPIPPLIRYSGGKSGGKPLFALTSVASRSLRRARPAAIKTLEVGINHNRQGAGPFRLFQRLAGDEAYLEGTISAIAHHPGVAGAQAVAQLRHYAEPVVAPINAATAKHVARPTLPDEVGAQLSDQVLYPNTAGDDKGEALTGERKYILHFDLGKLPPVSVFWNLAM
jgi:hypothetical protein